MLWQGSIENLTCYLSLVMLRYHLGKCLSHQGGLVSKKQKMVTITVDHRKKGSRTFTVTSDVAQVINSKWSRGKVAITFKDANGKRHVLRRRNYHPSLSMEAAAS